MIFSVKTWSGTRVVSIKDADFLKEAAGEGKTLVMTAVVPTVGQPMPRLYLHDWRGESAEHIILFDAIVRRVDLHRPSADELDFSFMGSQGILCVKLADSGATDGRSIDQFVTRRAMKPEKCTDDPACLPHPWTFTWNVHPGGNWDVGREDARLGFFPADREIRAVSGPDWGREDLPYPETSVSLSAETVAALRAWCAAPETAFPDLPGIKEAYRPKLDAQHAPRLARALDQIERIAKL